MQLANFLNKLIKKDGFILVDATGREYLIGNPKNSNPIKLKLLDKKLYRKLLIFPDLHFGEAYVDGKIKIENGTLSEFLNIVLLNIGRKETNKITELINKFRLSYRFLTNFNFIPQSKKNVSHHYDISDDLYDLFLDEKRQYSCAYFKQNTDSLETAQNNKIEHIIKKLNLKPDQKVLDIGSGWGSLAIEIAKKTGCRVTGITLSKNQYNYSVAQAKKLNMHNQVDFKLIDYRQVYEKFDRIVSVGMFEHVGKKFYKTFFKKMYTLLNDGGIALLHTIGSINPPRSPHPWVTKYIFPGGYTPSLSEVALPIEKSGLIISDIEVLKMHYAYTLKHWKERFLANKEKILKMFDERFFRMFEFYLTSCEKVFEHGDQVVFQFQLSKELHTIPRTRDYIYQ